MGGRRTDLFDALACAVAVHVPGVIQELPAQIANRAEINGRELPKDNALFWRLAAIAAALERFQSRVVTPPPPPPPAPEGTVDLAAHRSRRGRGTGPSPRGAA